jgi:hypothetical protein
VSLCEFIPWHLIGNQIIQTPFYPGGQPLMLDVYGIKGLGVDNFRCYRFKCLAA